MRGGTNETGDQWDGGPISMRGVTNETGDQWDGGPMGRGTIRDGSRIQKGGFVHSEGGVSYRNFRSGSKLLQGPGQINKQKKIADSRRGGGGSDHPQRNLYPRMDYIILYYI